MSNETQPFDQLATRFRDAVVDKVKQSDGYGENAPFDTDDTQEWSEGFINTADCAQIVFRDFLERGIIAARQPAPVMGDEAVEQFSERIIRFINRRSEVENNQYVIPMPSVLDKDLMQEFRDALTEFAAQAVQVPDDLRETVEDLVRQLAHTTTRDGVPCLWTGGLSALEGAFAVLGWDDPHPCPDDACERDGCGEWATCGVNTTDGYKRLCSAHAREVWG